MERRSSYEDSCRFLQDEGWIDKGLLPSLPQQQPHFSDPDLDVYFFRTWIDQAQFDNLTLPRIYIGRSRLTASSFVGADLSESVANWDDFEDVDFSLADCSRFDFRSCIFRRVRFCGACLNGADFRHCDFQACDFAGADLFDAKLTRKQGAELSLSRVQREAIAWQDEDGPEPDGG